MANFRFSTRTVLLITACVAIYFAMLARPLPAAGAGAYILHYLLLYASILMIVFRAGSVRAFWIGFAVFGWGDVARHWSGQGNLSIVQPLLTWLLPLFHGSTPDSDTAVRFLKVGAQLADLGLPFIGGLLALWLYRTREPASSE